MISYILLRSIAFAFHLKFSMQLFAVDLLGWPLHRRCSRRHLPRGHHQGHPLQEPRL